MHPTLLFLLSLLVFSCNSSTNTTQAEANDTYSVDETVWMKDSSQDAIAVPAEFVEGKASFNQLRAWSFAYFSYLDTSLRVQDMQIDSVDINNDQQTDFVFTQVLPAQNSTYFVFKKAAMGFKYLGQLQAVQFKFILSSTKQNYILASQQLSAQEQFLALYTTQPSLKKIGNTIAVQAGAVTVNTTLPSILNQEENIINLSDSSLASMFQF